MQSRRRKSESQSNLGADGAEPLPLSNLGAEGAEPMHKLGTDTQPLGNLGAEGVESRGNAEPLRHLGAEPLGDLGDEGAEPLSNLGAEGTEPLGNLGAESAEPLSNLFGAEPQTKPQHQPSEEGRAFCIQCGNSLVTMTLFFQDLQKGGGGEEVAGRPFAAGE